MTKQASNLKVVAITLLLPGILINTSATDYSPIEQLQTQRFHSQQWSLFGSLVSTAK